MLISSKVVFSLSLIWSLLICLATKKDKLKINSQQRDSCTNYPEQDDLHYKRPYIDPNLTKATFPDLPKRGFVR